MKYNGKSLTVFVVFAIAVLSWTSGCGPSPTPPEPLVDNKQSNEITDRQKLVREFMSAEVFIVPDNNALYVARDTNGAVWFVHSSRGAPLAAGKTLIFPATVPPPVKLPVSDYELAVEDKVRLLKLIAEAYSNNVYYFSNNAYLKSMTNQPLAEDPK